MSGLKLQAPEAGALIVRPGLLASIFNVGLATLWAAFGVVLAAQPGNRGADFAFPIVITLSGLALAVDLLGMRVEAGRSSVSKVYFFGLLSRRIPYGELTLKEDWQNNANLIGGYEVVQFKGNHVSFSMTPFYVWRRRDVRVVIGECLRISRTARRGVS